MSEASRAAYVAQPGSGKATLKEAEMLDENRNEEWRPVVGFEGIYSVSSHGRMRRETGCLRYSPGGIIAGSKCHGYVLVRLAYHGGKKRTQVHRLVAEAFLGSRHDSAEVNHKNGIKDDNRVENLEWVSRSENVKHAYRQLGVYPRRGEACGMSKLKDDQVVQIRDQILAGVRQADIAENFSISKVTISNIAIGKTWRHVTGFCRKVAIAVVFMAQPSCCFHLHLMEKTYVNDRQSVPQGDREPVAWNDLGRDGPQVENGDRVPIAVDFSRVVGDGLPK